jgi:hypothetical protein
VDISPEASTFVAAQGVFILYAVILGIGSIFGIKAEQRATSV